jgi:hypothetical protein
MQKIYAGTSYHELIGPDLYNPVREGRISTTAKMATPEHLEKESGMPLEARIRQDQVKQIPTCLLILVATVDGKVQKLYIEGRISTTAKMATPEHLEKESGMLIYGEQMEDNKYTARLIEASQHLPLIFIRESRKHL